ncbi:fumarylacetoacetate hydrolase family protein [Nocardioides fonticola]|uniref:Fumarylacetoacetate hydrolase family protein n=1 Tax=Nocardioides fonticola TaxID=450363 RepID=A0ABP7XRH6_9ACTN
MDTRDAVVALAAARRERRTIDPFTDTHPDLDEAWGYAVQDLDLADRLAAGERSIGMKLGLTSAAKQERMAVHRPVVGFLTDAHLLATGEVARRLDSWVQPRIEPEIAFVTAVDLGGGLTRADAPTVVASVLVAAEILDSRFTGYRFRLPDVLADATSAAGVLLGEPRPVGDLDLASLACRVEVDGVLEHEATGAAVLGDPWLALVELSAHLGRRGTMLPAGSLVLAGALTDAVPLTAGRRYRLVVDGLGEIVVDLLGAVGAVSP